MNFQIYTHMSIGLMQSGQIGDTFEILILLSVMPMNVMITANAQSSVDGQARIIVGQVIDHQKMPVMVVLNQGKRSEVALGSSKIVYDEQVSDEFKCHMYDRNVACNPFTDGLIKDITIHVYAVDKMMASNINYGHSYDYP
jgi:hypothetical protein